MELRIEESSGYSYRLFPDPELPEGWIVEDRTYLLRLTGLESTSDLAGCRLLLGDVDQGAGRYARPGELSWTWEVKDYAGRLVVGLERADGTPLLQTREILVDPNRAKLTREQFAQMLDDINAQAAIAYSLSPATERVALGWHRECLGLAQLEYIRQLLRPLQRAVEAIARRPCRTLVSVEECMDLACARTPDDRSFAWLLAHPSELCAVEEANVPPGARELHRQLQSHLPRRLQVSLKSVSHDVYENRLIKHFLHRMALVLRRTQLRLREAEQDPLLDEAIRRLASRRREEIERNRYREILYNLLNLDFLAKVGPLRHSKPVTQVLRKDPLYAQFYKLYRQLDRAISPFDGGPFRLSLEKTWQLYEYWCFFQVLAALRELAGDSLQFDARGLVGTHPDRLSLRLPGAEVKINDRLAVYYQKSYPYYGWREGSATRIGTYSHEMRPDITIEVYDGHGQIERVVVLDPKYRVSEQSINQAMDDLHTYKDAIVDPQRRRVVTTALVLCPSSENAKPLYFDDHYIETHGLGALVLRPGDIDLGSFARRLRRFLEYDRAG